MFSMKNYRDLYEEIDTIIEKASKGEILIEDILRNSVRHRQNNEIPQLIQF